jgi:hypothetical protein
METGLEKAQRIMKERRDAGEVIEKLNPVEKAKKNPKSLRMAINAKCWECSCEQRLEITNCTCVSCPLYPVRPYQKNSEEAA